VASEEKFAPANFGGEGIPSGLQIYKRLLYFRSNRLYVYNLEDLNGTFAPPGADKAKVRGCGGIIRFSELWGSKNPVGATNM